MAEKEYGKRTYKDTVFVDLFARDISARENFISLYNALHNEQLDPATAKITPIILEHVLYHGYFNDVSMLVNDKIIVFAEHQSTINENMPLRFLGYVSRVYEQMMDSRKRFARKLQMLPTPEFYVFYNGKENYPKEKILKLSSSFMEKFKKYENSENIQFPLEIIVKVININVEANSEILAKCKPLNEYSSFVKIVRKYSATEKEKFFDVAVQKAIELGILSDYLMRRRKEVENMVIGMYDYDLDMEVQRDEAREEGIQQGIAQGEHNARIETARALLSLGVNTIEQIATATGLSLAEVQELEPIHNP